MLKEFKTFIMRGSVIELAVGIVIGTAFGKIITSLVTDVILPPIGLLLHGVDFSNLFISLNGQAFTSLADAQKAGAPTINYGNFINNVLIFLIIAVVVFLMIRAINRLQGPAPVAPASTKECPYCFTVIPLKAIRCPNCTSEIK
jgi:large conductance mechanosensitive channel